MRVSTILVLLCLALLCMTSFVLAQDESTDAAASENTEIDPTRPDAQPESDLDNVPRRDAWKEQPKLTGLPLGENSALAVPYPILILILIGFLALVGYIIMWILNTDKERTNKAALLAKKREEKKAARNSSKKK